MLSTRWPPQRTLSAAEHWVVHAVSTCVTSVTSRRTAASSDRPRCAGPSAPVTAASWERRDVSSGSALCAMGSYLLLDP